MKKLLSVLIFAVTMALVGVVAVSAEDETIYTSGNCEVVQIGIRIERGIESPIYALKFGDTEKAEAAERYWRKLGNAGMNATLYKEHSGKGVDAEWDAVMYRRPGNDDERLELMENPQAEKWYRVYRVKKIELSAPFCFLAGQDLAKIELFKIYLDGSGGKIYLYPVGLKEAVELADKLSAMLEKTEL